MCVCVCANSCAGYFILAQIIYSFLYYAYTIWTIYVNIIDSPLVSRAQTKKE